MRASLATVVALVACYAPSPPAGAPCGAGGACPDGLVCAGPAGGEVCVVGGSAHDAADAPVVGSDAMPSGSDSSVIGDRDGDGVADVVDNCPDVANAGQENEDGDRFGDACDPCPPDANDNPTDEDHDGVADPCDPNPTTPGDRITMFEGFHHGVPAGWTQIGPWQGSGDDLVVVAPASSSYLVPTETIAGDGAFVVAITLDKVAPQGTTCDVQISLPFDLPSRNSLDCNFFQLTSGQRDQVLYDDFSGGPLTGSAVAWTPGAPYVFALVLRAGSASRTCATVDAAGTEVDISGTPPGQIAATAAAVSAFNVTARLSWMMMISSP